MRPDQARRSRRVKKESESMSWASLMLTVRERMVFYRLLPNVSKKNGVPFGLGLKPKNFDACHAW